MAIGEGAASQDIQPVKGIKDGEGQCVIYYGSVCRRYIGHRKVYVQSNETQQLIEKKLQEAMTVIDHSGDISQKCSEYAIPSLCFSAFPLCPGFNPEENLNFVTPRRLCREECELLEHDLCRQEYAIAKRHPLIGQQLPIPQCTDLPVIGSRESATCIRLGLPHLQPIVQDHSCYNFDDMTGESYRGTISVTAAGEPCRPWSHQLIYKSADFPELLGGHNYCRNPNSVERTPWCFSDSDSFRRERCSVPQCGLFGFESKYWVYASFGILGIALLFILTLLYCCFAKGCSSKGKKKRRRSQLESNSDVSGSMQTLEMGTLLRKCGGKITEIPLSNIQFQEELGEGAFGKVYSGEALFNYGDLPTRIAIKTLKASANAKTRNDFFREGELMAELKHRNIVELLGVVTKEEPRMLLFEYMSQGDLHQFLTKHSPRGDPNEFGAVSILDGNELLFISMQIANGMAYLANSSYIHRDLAARNCLVGEGLVVKIADFGLSRDVYSSDYYRVQTSSLLPIRWMDVNSILYGKFSTETDVWSFGVVLWEIYSFGLQPYYGYTNQEVIEMVRTRSLLPCPDNCPPKIYALMVECWTEVQSRRPSFDELAARLKQWLMPMPALSSTVAFNAGGVQSQGLFGSMGSNGKGLHYGLNSPHLGRWVEGTNGHNTIGSNGSVPHPNGHLHCGPTGCNHHGGVLGGGSASLGRSGSPATTNLSFPNGGRPQQTNGVANKFHAHHMHPQ